MVFTPYQLAFISQIFHYFDKWISPIFLLGKIVHMCVTIGTCLKHILFLEYVIGVLLSFICDITDIRHCTLRTTEI